VGTARAVVPASDTVSAVMRRTRTLPHGIIVHPVRRPRRRRFADAVAASEERVSRHTDREATPAAQARGRSAAARAGNRGHDVFVSSRSVPSSRSSTKCKARAQGLQSESFVIRCEA
jgi:hypothetical protein